MSFEKMQQFIHTFDDQLTKKYTTWKAFQSKFMPVENSISAYICRLARPEKIFSAIAKTLRLAITPSFSDCNLEKTTKYTRFNIWFLGVTKGIDLMFTDRFMEEEYEKESCDCCGDGKHVGLGHLALFQISIQTVLYIIFNSVPIDGNLTVSVGDINRAISGCYVMEEYYNQCEDGDCQFKVSDGECECYDEFMSSIDEVEAYCIAFLKDLCRGGMFNAQDFITGLSPYIIHPACSHSDFQIIIIRTIQDEANEKYRLAEQKRLKEEETKQRERKRLMKEMQDQEKNAKKIKKRLLELQNE